MVYPQSWHSHEQRYEPWDLGYTRLSDKANVIRKEKEWHESHVFVMSRICNLFHSSFWCPKPWFSWAAYVTTACYLSLEPLGGQICWARGEVLMFLKSLRLWWDMMGSYEGVQFMVVRLIHPFPRMFRYKPTFWGFPSLGNPHIHNIYATLFCTSLLACFGEVSNILDVCLISSKTFTTTLVKCPGCPSDVTWEQAGMRQGVTRTRQLSHEPWNPRIYVGLNEAINHRISPCFWPPDMVQ